MPAKSQAQARWAYAGCPGSGMSSAKCAEFQPKGPGSMRLPKKITVQAIRKAGKKR